jgi:competence protein ComEC
MSLKIHFLNVGHGDCTIIEHPSGRLTMIDINNASQIDEETRREIAAEFGISEIEYIAGTALARALKQSYRKTILASKGYDIDLSDPVEYFNERWFGKSIFRYIQSHPDLDHMRGLKRLSQEKIAIWNFWDTNHNIVSKECQDEADVAEWAEYRRLRSSASNPQVHHKYRDAVGSYWNQDDSGGNGDGIYVLAPTPELQIEASKKGDPNAHSYVLLVRFAGIKVILGGDATEAVWQSIYERYGKELKCDVLKASHHGRDSGFHLEAVKVMAPQYTIVSVGKKPETDASNRYRDYSQNVWSTRWRGNIVLTIAPDGKAVIEAQHDRGSATQRNRTSEGSLARP